MYMKKRLLPLLLAIVMVFSLAAPAYAAEDDAADLSGSIVILHTNDVHGGIAGYAKLAALKAQYQAQGAYVLLVDAGDFIQGDPTVSISQGATAVELMNLAGYDVVTTGNHEFDYGYANLTQLAESADFPILAANILYNGELAFGDHQIFTTDSGVKIGVFGLATPETATKAHPAKIQGVTFLGSQELYDCAQSQVDALTEAGCDYIIALGHLGIDDESAAEGNRSIDLLNNVTGIDVFIDGHSHSTLEEVKAATDGTGKVGDTVLTSTGTKLANVGVVTIKDGAITAENLATEELTVEPVAAISEKIAAINAEVEAEYGAVFATTEVRLNGDRAPGNRTEETNLGDLITDAMLWYATKDGGLEVADDHVVALTNGGGIRATIEAGDITKKDVNTVLPFGNTVCTVYVTGAELLEALEASTYCTPTAVGGFPQVAGLAYTINTAMTFDQGDLYPDSTYHAPASIQRVTINSVNGQPFSLTDTYAVVTNDFCAAGGDTYYAFKVANTVIDTGTPLDEALMAYITDELGGTVTAAQYGETAGRISVVSQFADVDADAWYADAVSYVALNGIMTGKGNGSFDPTAEITRGEVMTLLARYDGTDTSASDPWYQVGMDWSVEKSISDGTAVARTISRQELVTMLYRYAGQPEASYDLSSFADASDVADWSQAAMEWAVSAGILSGNGSGLNPTGTATRMEVAKIMAGFSQLTD
jgi:2',3'-cyclic-nucleotide 2'-phosphodiesterase (5'-nucleotidase family)